MTDLETKLRELRDSTWHDSIEGDMSKLRAAAAIGAAQRQAEIVAWLRNRTSRLAIDTGNQWAVVFARDIEAGAGWAP